MITANQARTLVEFGLSHEIWTNRVYRTIYQAAFNGDTNILFEGIVVSKGDIERLRKDGFEVTQDSLPPVIGDEPRIRTTISWEIK